MPLSKKGFISLLLVILVASFLRLYRIDELPPALAGDEASLGVLANRVLAGEGFSLYFAENYGEEPIYVYLVVVLFRLLGAQPLLIRGLSVALGILTIPVFYLFVRELFASEDTGALSLHSLLAAAWLGLSYWHVSYSRLGLQPILMPLCSLLTFYFLWRGLRSRRTLHLALAGLLLGVTMYTYQASRLVPVIVLLFVVYRSLSDRTFIPTYGRNVALLFVVAFLIFSPLGYYYLTHPDIFFWRAADVSIFNPQKHSEPPAQAALMSAMRTIGMFTYQGDRNWRHNLSGRPVFDPLSSGLFLLGLGIAVARSRKPKYAFLTIWLVIMSLPLIFTTPVDVPHFSRSIGALTASCIFPAIAVQTVWKWLKTKGYSRRTGYVFWASIAFLLVFTAILTYRDYFVIWANKDGLRRYYFDGKFADAAAAMNRQTDPDAVWILPLNAQASPYSEPGHYVVRFLYRGQAPLHFLRLDEGTAAEELTAVCQQRKSALVLDWKDYDLARPWAFIDSDPKRLLAFLLGKYGRLSARQEFQDFDVAVYDLPETADFAIADYFEPFSSSFGNQIALKGVAYGGSPQKELSTTGEVERDMLPSGENAWVVLLWEALLAPSSNYKVGVSLVDGQGRSVGQADKILLSSDAHLTSEWDPGQLEMDYYTLPSLPATAPGQYGIQVVMYDAETMDRLTVLDEPEGVTKTTLVVGTLQVVEPSEPPHVEPTVQLVGAVRDTVPSIRLLGYDLPMRTVGPGETVSVALYWQATENVTRDYLISLRLKDSQDRLCLSQTGRPVDGSYPTTQWDVGEVLRDWHDLALPADVPQGVYQILVGLLEDEELLSEVSLGQVEVQGRARRFVMPEIEHPYEATLGQAIRFLGYDLSSDQPRPGEALHLTLYWQALKEMDTSYTVFTHLLDPDSRIRGQVDNAPGGGEAPTTSWVEREIIIDEYEIIVDPGAPPGDHAVEIGMYDATTGRRLPVSIGGQLAEGDRLLLGQIRVLP